MSSSSSSKSLLDRKDSALPLWMELVPSKSHPVAQIAVMTLNRPQARNALSRDLVDCLRECLSIVEGNPNGTIRGLVVRSSSPTVFCAGADLRERREMSAEQVDVFLGHLRDAFTRLSAVSVPTVSVVEGHALGGGLELALSTDLRVVGPGAKLGLPETRLGIIPGAGGTQRLTRLIGPARAKDLIYAARILDASQAIDTGIAEYHVADPLDKAFELMETYCQNSPTGIAQAKKAIEFASEAGESLQTGLDFERSRYQVCMTGPDRDEGLLAFKEKRAPVYGINPKSSSSSSIISRRGSSKL